MAAHYSSKVEGPTNSLDYRLFVEKDGKRLSPFHDIPLEAGKQIFNMVVEIPRDTKAKFEINKAEQWNPIKQDVKDGKLRFVEYKNGYMWNYGAFPQTWEDPSFKHPDTEAKGDNDPLDVVEIGSKVLASGSVIQVKVLGALALIDEGETDWKIIAIDVTDPLASKLNDIEDIEKHKPGYLHDTYVWFKDYKTILGKPENKFAYDGKTKPRDFALKVIEENHAFWKKLVAGTPPKGISVHSLSTHSK